MSRDLTALLEHPNVRRYLDLIAQAEGTARYADPYRVAFGGSAIPDLSRHPGIARRFRQTDGKANTTTAAGKYQFLHSTWNDVAGALGLSDFSPRSQDLGALELMRRSGSLDDVLRGDYATAVRKDGRTWASLPSSPYPQPKRSPAFIAQALGRSATPTFLPPYAPLAAALSAPPAQPHYRPVLPPMWPVQPPGAEPSQAIFPPSFFTPTDATTPASLVPPPEPPYSIDLDLQHLRRSSPKS
jgi:muramidase (phage lysozyme)